MAQIIKKTSSAVPSEEKYLHLIGTTDFSNGDWIDIISSLERTSKQVTIVCDAYSSITVRFNAIQVIYPEVNDNQFQGDRGGERRLDYDSPTYVFDSKVQQVILGNGDSFTFDNPCRNIQITALSGNPEVTAE